MSTEQINNAIREMFHPEQYALSSKSEMFYQHCAVQAIQKLRPDLNTFLKWGLEDQKHLTLLKQPWMYDYLSDWTWDRSSVQSLFTQHEALTNVYPTGLNDIALAVKKRNPECFDSDIWQTYLYEQSKKYKQAMGLALVEMWETLPNNRLAECIYKRWNLRLSISSRDSSDSEWLRLSTRLKPSQDEIVNKILTNVLNLAFKSGQYLHADNHVRELAKNFAYAEKAEFQTSAVELCLQLIFETKPMYGVNQKERNLFRSTFFEYALGENNPNQLNWIENIKNILAQHPNPYKGIDLLLSNASDLSAATLQRFLWDHTTKTKITDYETKKLAHTTWNRIFHFSNDETVKKDIIWQFARYPESFVKKDLLEKPWSKEMKTALFVWIVQRGHHGKASSYGPNMSRRLKKLLVAHWPEWKKTNINDYTSTWIEKAIALYDIPKEALIPSFGILETSMFESMPIIRALAENNAPKKGFQELSLDTILQSTELHP